MGLTPSKLHDFELNLLQAVKIATKDWSQNKATIARAYAEALTRGSGQAPQGLDSSELLAIRQCFVWACVSNHVPKSSLPGQRFKWYEPLRKEAARKYQATHSSKRTRQR